MRMAARWVGAVVFLVVASSPAWAQQAEANASQAPAVVSAAPVAPGLVPPGTVAPAVAQDAGQSVAERLRPTVDGVRLLVPAQAPATQRELAHQPAYRASRGVPLMIVGGAMFLAGAIIDDRAGDAVMVAGVVVAAIGLLEYLQ